MGGVLPDAKSRTVYTRSGDRITQPLRRARCGARQAAANHLPAMWYRPGGRRGRFPCISDNPSWPWVCCYRRARPAHTEPATLGLVSPCLTTAKCRTYPLPEHRRAHDRALKLDVLIPRYDNDKLLSKNSSKKCATADPSSAWQHRACSGNCMVLGVTTGILLRVAHGPAQNSGVPKPSEIRRSSLGLRRSSVSAVRHLALELISKSPEPIWRNLASVAQEMGAPEIKPNAEFPNRKSWPKSEP